MLHAKFVAILFCFIFLLIGCSSTSNQTNAADMGMAIPSWVTNPSPQDGGLAASSCVIASNSFATDKSQAAAQARGELARQLNTRVSGLQEEYVEKMAENQGAQTETNFKSVISQLTSHALQGSTIQKVDYAQLGDQKNLCTLVTISQENSDLLFRKIVNVAPIQFDPENETLMYLKFIQAENSMK